MAATEFKTTLEPGNGFWRLLVDAPGRVRREYRYSSEAQARYCAAVFELGATWLPPPVRKILKRSKRRAKLEIPNEQEPSLSRTG